MQPGLWSRNSNFRLRLQHWSVWLRLQNDLVHCKVKDIVLFIQLACPTNYVCGTGTQISGSGHPLLLGLRLHTTGCNKLMGSLSHKWKTYSEQNCLWFWICFCLFLYDTSWSGCKFYWFFFKLFDSLLPGFLCFGDPMRVP